MTTASFGSISSGTMRSEDLLDTFADELESFLSDDETNKEEAVYRELIAEARNVPYTDDGDCEDVERAIETVEELFNALDEFAPPYGYFGAHPGDGACYGFWLPDDFPDHNFDGLRVDDTSEVPADYVGEILHVNDHGNITLYAKDEGSEELREIWSLV